MGDVVRKTGVWATAVTVSPVSMTANHGRRVFTAREYRSRKRLLMRRRDMSKIPDCGGLVVGGEVKIEPGMEAVYQGAEKASEQGPVTLSM